ncbi:hypothetical protein CFP56_029759 [Quercus suber]|uniref:Uncharacterized protein n=1 Tax=Quercus suber TaxID=58331 RepID=A0AAW0LVI4_QUESU
MEELDNLAAQLEALLRDAEEQKLSLERFVRHHQVLWYLEWGFLVGQKVLDQDVIELLLLLDFRKKLESAVGLNGFIINNRLINLGFQSNKFTWTNKCPFGATIKERFDIAIANESWCCPFPNANLKHYPITGSDHAPIILCTMGETHIYPKPFRFESMWTRDPSSFAVIKGALIKRFHGSLTYCLSQKIREAEFLLKKCNKDVFGNICYKIKSITD